jgi:hypothetical protein
VAGDPDQLLDAFEPFIAGTPRTEHHVGLAAVVAPVETGADDVIHALVTSGGRHRHAASGDQVGEEAAPDQLLVSATAAALLTSVDLDLAPAGPGGAQRVQGFPV